jgi:hypothetical protein
VVEHHSSSEFTVLVPITLESCVLSRRIGVGSSVEELLSSPSKIFSNQESLWFAKVDRRLGDCRQVSTMSEINWSLISPELKENKAKRVYLLC